MEYNVEHLFKSKYETKSLHKTNLLIHCHSSRYSKFKKYRNQNLKKLLNNYFDKIKF